MRSLSPVNRHHACESATGLATLNFPDRGAHFRDKVVSRLRSLLMIYRILLSDPRDDRMNTKPVKELKAPVAVQTQNKSLRTRTFAS